MALYIVKPGKAATGGKKTFTKSQVRKASRKAACQARDKAEARCERRQAKRHEYLIRLFQAIAGLTVFALLVFLLAQITTSAHINANVPLSILGVIALIIAGAILIRPRLKGGN